MPGKQEKSRDVDPPKRPRSGKAEANRSGVVVRKFPDDSGARITFAGEGTPEVKDTPRAAKLFQLGHLRFHSSDGTVTGAAVVVQLTPKEADLLSVFCAHSDRFLSAREVFDLAWNEPQAKEWRARFDTQLANLRDKLGAHLPDLFENTRSRGYRLKVPFSPRDDPSEDAAEEEPKEVSTVAQGAGRLDRETVIIRATEVIGDEQEAMRWLGTPVRALDYATPISRLSDPEGQAAVLRVLTQLEHGVL